MGVVMSELLTSIPGDIPGLLRRGSPIIHPSFGAGLCACPSEKPGGNMLDLTDPTGRAHAAWWIQAARVRSHGGSGPAYLATITGWYTALHLAIYGLDMTPEQIDTLARLVLRLAGRS